MYLTFVISITPSIAARARLVAYVYVCILLNVIRY